ASVARPSAGAEPAPWDRDAGTGEFPPTPIMRWFVQHGGLWERFSQSILLGARGLRQADLLKAVQSLIDTHDVLRMQVTEGADWKLRIAPRGATCADTCVRSVDLVGLDQAGRQARVQREAEEAEARLDPRAGRIIEAVLFSGGD